ncbi:hypothetical protein MN608_03301 [Microdochium nivale]|nr:hypothetical protein MN608_03301 [Microdochium nivale]
MQSTSSIPAAPLDWQKIKMSLVAVAKTRAFGSEAPVIDSVSMDMNGCGALPKMWRNLRTALAAPGGSCHEKVQTSGLRRHKVVAASVQARCASGKSFVPSIRPDCALNGLRPH